MWKIAYADFMTAMMALFLVLWLVNSTDEQTQAQIANYFNPIDLSDRTTTDRGVNDKSQGGTGQKGEDNDKKSGNNDDKSAPLNDLARHGTSEEALFSDPYDVLNKLAAKAVKLPLPVGESTQPLNASPAAGGDSFRDPFDPNFRVDANNNKVEHGDLDPAPLNSAERKDQAGEEQKNAFAVEPSVNDRGMMPFADKLAAEAEKAAELEKQQQSEGKTGKREEEVSDAKTEAADLKMELLKSVAQSGLAHLPDISVEQTPEGILISVTDHADFEMFALSSAEPKPELVVLMEHVAGLLKKQRGKAIIRGHTDARPFRSQTYDNWRLSTARAHIAQYMLMRGGLPKERIERIEGYADRSPKLASDPFAAQNRRIEILLRPEKA
jgi:chemotaxis protein MotB